MAGQSSNKTVKEVKACIKGIEHNNQTKGGSGGTEAGANTKPMKHPIGKC